MIELCHIQYLALSWESKLCISCKRLLYLHTYFGLFWFFLFLQKERIYFTNSQYTFMLVDKDMIGLNSLTSWLKQTVTRLGFRKYISTR